MLLRISLVIAIIAGLAVGVLNFVMVKEKIETTEKHRAEEQAAKEAAQTELASTKKDLDKTTADLKRTQENLAATEAQRDKAQAEVASVNRKATDLTEKLAKATQERDVAQSDLAAYKATGLTPAQIVNFDKQIKGLQKEIEGAADENKFLNRELAKAKNELAKLTDKGWKPPLLPAALRGKVLVCDPKWDFVVLDVGEEQGVMQDGEVLVSRDGKLVAKLSVRLVEKGQCIANVLPEWKLGEVQEGDAIYPAL